VVFAELKETLHGKQRFQRVSFGCLEDTWREKNAAEGEEVNVVAKGKLLDYLNPITAPMTQVGRNGHETSRSKSSTESRRVVDRPDFQELLFPLEES
jgi:hypothetical protein